MTNIIVVCLITYSVGIFHFTSEWYKVDSIAMCSQKASTLSWGQVSLWYVYDLNKPREAADFEIRCGKEGRDCK